MYTNIDTHVHMHTYIFIYINILPVGQVKQSETHKRIVHNEKLDLKSSYCQETYEIPWNEGRWCSQIEFSSPKAGSVEITTRIKCILFCCLFFFSPQCLIADIIVKCCLLEQSQAKKLESTFEKMRIENGNMQICLESG